MTKGEILIGFAPKESPDNFKLSILAVFISPLENTHH